MPNSAFQPVNPNTSPESAHVLREASETAIVPRRTQAPSKDFSITQTTAEKGLFAAPLRRELCTANVKMTHLCKNRWAQLPVNIISSIGVLLTAILEVAITAIELVVMLLAAPILPFTKRYKGTHYLKAVGQEITQLATATLRLLAPLSIITSLFGYPLRIDRAQNNGSSRDDSSPPASPIPPSTSPPTDARRPTPVPFRPPTPFAPPQPTTTTTLGTEFQAIKEEEEDTDSSSDTEVASTPEIPSSSPQIETAGTVTELPAQCFAPIPHKSITSFLLPDGKMVKSLGIWNSSFSVDLLEGTPYQDLALDALAEVEVPRLKSTYGELKAQIDAYLASIGKGDATLTYIHLIEKSEISDPRRREVNIKFGIRSGNSDRPVDHHTALVNYKI